MLITNSDYQYTDRMMSHAYDRYLKAEGMTWRDVFDMVHIPPVVLLTFTIPPAWGVRLAWAVSHTVWRALPSAGRTNSSCGADRAVLCRGHR